MAEEKKNNTTKKTNTKKAPVKKKNVTNQKKKSAPKKVEIKKVEVKKVEVKDLTPKKEKLKVVEEKEVKRPKTTIEPKKEKTVEKEEQLERTMIFDGAQKKNLKEVVEKLEKDNVVLKDKVIKRSKVKKIIVAILIILMSITMIVTSIYLGKNIKAKYDSKKEIPTLNTNIYDKVKEYREELNDENTQEETKTDDIIKEITLKQFENKIMKKENINVLVSSNTCYFCIQFEPIIEETLKDSGKTIYKIDIAKMSDKEVERFREYYAFTITPTIFIIQDGVVTAEKIGSMDSKTLSTWASENLV